MSENAKRTLGLECIVKLVYLTNGRRVNSMTEHVGPCDVETEYSLFLQRVEQAVRCLLDEERDHPKCRHGRHRPGELSNVEVVAAKKIVERMLSDDWDDNTTEEYGHDEERSTEAVGQRGQGTEAQAAGPAGAAAEGGIPPAGEGEETLPASDS